MYVFIVGMEMCIQKDEAVDLRGKLLSYTVCPKPYRGTKPQDM